MLFSVALILLCEKTAFKSRQWEWFLKEIGRAHV